MYKLIYSKFITFSNIEIAYFTFSMLKFDTSRYFREVHPENIYSILIVEIVMNLDKSSDFKELHPLNISSRLIKEDTSNEENLIDSNEVHSENILFV